MPEDPRIAKLTRRDREIINLAAQGMTDLQIGQQLGLSRGTIIGYWSRIRLKLQVASRTEAVAFMKEQALKASEESGQALRTELLNTQAEASQIKRLSAELEAIVRQRTAELETANQELRAEIERRTEAEKALRASEAKFRNLYDTAEVALFSSRLDGSELLEANARAIKLFGGTKRGLIGKPTLGLWLDLAQREAIVKKLAARGRIENVPCQILSLDKKVKHCTVNATLDRETGIVQWAVVDVTEKVQAQRTLEKNNLRARLLLDLHEKSPKLSDEEMYKAILDIAVALTDSSIGFFRLISECQSATELTIWNDASLKDCAAPYTDPSPIGEAGLWAEALREMKPVIFNNYAEAPGKKGLPEGHNELERFMSVPIIRDGCVRAVVGLGNKKLPYDEEDVRQIELLARDVQVLLDNRKLHAELVRSESEVRRKLEALVSPGDELSGIRLTDLLDLEEVEKTFKMLRRLTGLVAGLIGPDGQGYAGSGWQEICEKFHRAAGPSSERCLESDRLLTADIQPGAYKLYKCPNNLWEMATPIVVAGQRLGTLMVGQFFFDDEEIDYDLFARQAEEFGYDKAAYLASLEKVPRVSRDDLHSAVALFSSIANQLVRQCYSKLKIAKALHERQTLLDAVTLAEQKFRVAFETSPDSVTLHRLSDGMYLEANEGVCKISGYSKQELIGRTWFEIDLWADPEDSRRFMEELSRNGIVLNFRARLKRKDGGIIHKLISASKLTVNGEECLLVVGRDVTDIVTAEEELRLSRENLREAARIAKVARWEYDLAADSFRTSDLVFDFLPVQPVQRRISLVEILDYFSEPDRAELQKQLERLQRDGTPMALEAEATLDDGSKRWLSILGEARRDESGRVAKIVGTLQDVTERKTLEIEVEENLNRLNAIFAHTPDHIFEQDAELRYLYFTNPLFGGSAEHMIGKTDCELLDPQKAEELTRVKRQVLETGKAIDYRTEIRKPGHEPQFFEGTYVPKFDKSGKPVGLFGFFRNVTRTQKLLDELEKANERLTASQRVMEGIIEGMPDAIFRFDAKRRIVYASGQAVQVTDRPIRELQGASVAGLGLPSDATAKVDAAVRKALRKGATQEVEVLGVKGGQQRHFNWRLVPELDGEGKAASVLAVVRDMTEYRKALSDFAMLFEQMLNGFALHEVIVDEAGRPVDYRFLAVNPAYEKLTGLSASDLLGRTVREVLPGIEPEWIEKFGRVALTGEPAHFEGYAAELKRHFEVAAFQTAPMQFACIFADITDRVRAVEELREYQQELERMVERRTAQLAEANAELEAFSYSVSHDLRAPLRTISGFAKILLEDYSGTLDEEGEYLLNRIAHSAEHMARLIDGLLRLSRINRTNLNVARVNLSDICFRYIESLDGAEGRGRIEWRIEPGVFADCDEMLAESLLDNLLSNAVKYSSKAERPIVQFGACEVDGQRAFFVRDNGEGFDMAHADKLFTPFQRLHHAGEYEGLGIGLATAKRVVARHGGRIWAESAPGQGATFFFTLAPYGEAADPAGPNKNGRGDTI